MAGRPQTHLRLVIAEHGDADATQVMRSVIETGLNKRRADEQIRRIAERGTDKKLNPSVSDAGRCERKVVLSLLNIPESNPPDFDTLLRFELGHAYEEAIAGILDAYQGATYMREERVAIDAGETEITGRKDFDAVRIVMDEAIVELKSMNSRALSFLLKRGEPNSDHVSQANLYLHATGKEIAYLVYLAAGSTKGEPPLHSWIVRYDKERAGRDIAALVEADRKAKAGTVPPIPKGYTKRGWPCGYCNYQGLCFDTEKALKASIEMKAEV